MIVLVPGANHDGLAAAESGDSGGHEEGRSRKIAQTFFKSVAPVRLPQTAAGKLADLDETSGWLGDSKTQEVSSCDNFAGNKRAASWLVDESTTAAWRSLGN